MRKENCTTRSIVLVGMFTAIISVLSIFRIPMPTGVPATLQTFAVPLCGFVLGRRLGAASAALYVLLGFIGVPVYSGMNSGPGVLFGLAGGFLFGYVIFAWMSGFGFRWRNKIVRVGSGIVGLLICHLMGVIQYMFLTKTAFTEAVVLVSLPYIVKDIIFVIAAYVVAIAVRRGLAASDILVDARQKSMAK